MEKIKSENGNMGKSETFYKLTDMLKGVYKDNAAISESEIELLAADLEYSIDIGYSCADIISTVISFWQRILCAKEHGKDIKEGEDCLSGDDGIDEAEVDSSLAKEWEIADEIMDLLELNEKNARALCKSFVDECNSYNAFVRLVTDFREYLTADELKEIFDTAEIFDKELVDCYRDD